MTERGQKLLEEALALAPGERADFAATLLESLDGEPDEAVEEAWAAEVEKRIREVESGEVKLIAWAEARRQLLDRLDGRQLA